MFHSNVYMSLLFLNGVLVEKEITIEKKKDDEDKISSDLWQFSFFLVCEPDYHYECKPIYFDQIVYSVFIFSAQNPSWSFKGKMWKIMFFQSFSSVRIFFFFKGNITVKAYFLILSKKGGENLLHFNFDIMWIKLFFSQIRMQVWVGCINWIWD